jgi:Probable zinc-ribbon domain
MKSGKQRREEIKAKRLERLEKHAAAVKLNGMFDVRLGAVISNVMRLAANNSYGVWPAYYVDRPFVCRDCGSHELWTAKQQKWWYEIAQGPIYSSAVRCRPCRIMERARADEVRRVSLEGMQRKLAQKKLKE